jgi:hypothetical protein
MNLQKERVGTEVWRPGYGMANPLILQTMMQYGTDERPLTPTEKTRVFCAAIFGNLEFRARVFGINATIFGNFTSLTCCFLYPHGEIIFGK